MKVFDINIIIMKMLIKQLPFDKECIQRALTPPLSPPLAPAVTTLGSSDFVVGEDRM